MNTACEYSDLHLALGLIGLALTVVGAYWCGVYSELRSIARANRAEHEERRRA